MQTGATTPNNAGSCKPTMLRPFARGEKFDRFQTLRNNTQEGVQTDATCNIQQCWELLVNNVASVCTQPKCTRIRVRVKMRFQKCPDSRERGVG